MKKLIFLLTVCAIVLGLGAPLSKQSDEEILAFLEEYGIERFGQFADISDEQLVLYVRHVIGVIEEHGEYVTTAGAWEFWEMDEAIENATKQYYGIQALPSNYIRKERGMFHVEHCGQEYNLEPRPVSLCEIAPNPAWARREWFSANSRYLRDA